MSGYISSIDPCPFCNIKIMCDEKADRHEQSCPVCGYPIRLPNGIYYVVEMEDGEQILAEENCLERVN